MKLKSLFSALLLGCAMMAQAQSANDDYDHQRPTDQPLRI